MNRLFWLFLVIGALLQTRLSRPISTASPKTISFDIVRRQGNDLFAWLNDPCAFDSVLVRINRSGAMEYINPTRSWESLPIGLYFWKNACNRGIRTVKFNTGKNFMRYIVKQEPTTQEWRYLHGNYTNGTQIWNSSKKSWNENRKYMMYKPHASACVYEFMQHLARLPQLNLFDLVLANQGRQLRLPDVPTLAQTKNTCLKGQRQVCPQVRSDQLPRPLPRVAIPHR